MTSASGIVVGVGGGCLFVFSTEGGLPSFPVSRFLFGSDSSFFFSGYVITILSDLFCGPNMLRLFSCSVMF
jgi:hypothetical protein